MQTHPIPQIWGILEYAALPVTFELSLEANISAFARSSGCMVSSAIYQAMNLASMYLCAPDHVNVRVLADDFGSFMF